MRHGFVALVGFWVQVCDAQVPTGTVSGMIFDPSGARMPGVALVIEHRELAVTRQVNSTAEGVYSAPALPPGTYDVEASAPGFQPLSRAVIVYAGVTTTADLTLTIAPRTDAIEIHGSANGVQAETHSVEGTVQREQVRELPLNGRNFIELAKLEPGTLVTTAPGAQGNRQFSVSVLGASPLRTRITVDGGPVTNFVAGDAAQNFSQELIQEFQISTVNFDAPVAFSASGAVNIVTRAGGNEFHGAGFFYFRDHNGSAYPTLRRNSASLNFAKRHAGAAGGGPIWPKRLFFFGNIENVNQDGIVDVQPLTPEFAAFATRAASPFDSLQTSIRIDVRATERHTGFLRYSHDGNNTFAPGSAPPGLTVPGVTIEGIDQLLRSSQTALPSNWRREKNWADQSALGITSVISARSVNDLRLSYFYLHSKGSTASPEDCSAACPGIGSPAISIPAAGLFLGESVFGPATAVLRNLAVSEHVTWQLGAHRMRFGLEWERQTSQAVAELLRAGSLVLYSPEIVRRAGGPVPLPSAYTGVADLLRLPLVNFQLAVGDPRLPPAYNFDEARTNNRWFFFAQDTWRLHPRFTLNYAVRYTFDTNALNHDLTRPVWLAPFGVSDQAPRRDTNNIGPSAGFAWTATRDARTVVRAGSGIYYDAFLTIDKLTERALLGPRGTGRFPVDSSFVPNVLPGIPGAAVGRPLSFTDGPTGFTGSLAASLLPAVRQQLLAVVGPPSSNLAVRNVQVLKQAAGLFPNDFAMPYAVHFNVGVQREFGRGVVVTADFVLRQFVRTTVLNVDRNRWDSMGGPVLRACSAPEALTTDAPCSTGPVAFHLSAGRNRYTGLLLKAQRRFGDRLQFTASYALSTQKGLNGILNKENWFESYGPLPSDRRHVMTAAGLVRVPLGFRVSLLSTIASKTPFSAYVAGLDFNGDGTSSDLLPGLQVNRLNRGVGTAELVQLVENFNREWAGRTTPRGQRVPVLAVPDRSIALGDSLISQDVRIARPVRLRENLSVVPLIEVFNILNVANLSGFGTNLAEPSAFGQPSSRVVQVFGSGGPRALQFAVRLEF